MRRLYGLLLLFLTLSVPAWAQDAPSSGFPSDISQLADERILDYHSDISIHADGSMDVRETIKVRARGEQIKRGIFRDFPTRYQDRIGNPYRVGFDVVEVLRDGRPDAWHSEDRDNGVRVYIGSTDVFLQPGEYTYTLAYRTTRQLGSFADHDELYWNVNGNGWAFVIDRASATVTLPTRASSSQLRLEAYTGPEGAQGSDFTSDVDFEGRSTFRTTKMLGRNEGLTIVVSFPKGIVREPTQDEKIRDFVFDNRPALVGAFGLFILVGYYMVVWAQVGRDPEAGTIMPLYEPPQNFSPASMRYLTRMGFDDKTFAAAVLDMAVKGHVTIQEDSGTFTVSKLDGQMTNLSPEERVVSMKLLGSVKSVELKTANHATIRSALQALENALKLSQEKTYFLSNSRYLIPGFLISILVLIAMVASLGNPSNMAGAAFMTVWLSGWTAGVFFLVRAALGLWKVALFGGGGQRLASLGGAVFMSLFALPFLGGEIAGLYAFSTMATPGAAVLLLVLIGVNILFHYLLKAPTSAGRRVLDQIEGFRMFLTAVEGDRMRMLGAVNKTPELFEKYLPYALALDVEHQWAEQFAEVFARTAQAPGGAGYSPSWYSGSNWNRMAAGSFASSFGSSFSSAISSSSTPPGSRSGSSSGGGGGGGSSGGGGGGGGGGGW